MTRAPARSRSMLRSRPPDEPAARWTGTRGRPAGPGRRQRGTAGAGGRRRGRGQAGPGAAARRGARSTRSTSTRRWAWASRSGRCCPRTGTSSGTSTATYGVGNCSHLRPVVLRHGLHQPHVLRVRADQAGRQVRPGRDLPRVRDLVVLLQSRTRWTCGARTTSPRRTQLAGPGAAGLDGRPLRFRGRGDHARPPSRTLGRVQRQRGEPDENLTSTVRSFADGKFSRLTLMLRAKDESDPEPGSGSTRTPNCRSTTCPSPVCPTKVGVIPGDGTLAYCEA